MNVRQEVNLVTVPATSRPQHILNVGLVLKFELTNRQRVGWDEGSSFIVHSLPQ